MMQLKMKLLRDIHEEYHKILDLQDLTDEKTGIDEHGGKEIWIKRSPNATEIIGVEHIPTICLTT